MRGSAFFLDCRISKGKSGQPASLCFELFKVSFTLSQGKSASGFIAFYISDKIIKAKREVIVKSKVKFLIGIPIAFVFLSVSAIENQNPQWKGTFSFWIETITEFKNTTRTGNICKQMVAFIPQNSNKIQVTLKSNASKSRTGRR